MRIRLAPARAAASRRNGAKSRGPKTSQGKARSAHNALKHGLRAATFVVGGDESAEEFAALESALIEELAPDGALQGLLARRIARAAWRLERAERLAVGTGSGPRRRAGWGKGPQPLSVRRRPNPAAKRPSCSSSACAATRISGRR